MVIYLVLAAVNITGFSGGNYYDIFDLVWHFQRAPRRGAVAADFCILNFGTKEILVASRIQKPAAAEAELRISGAGHFQLAPWPNIQLRNKHFAGGAFPAGASAKYTNAKYKKLIVYIHIFL